MKVLQKCVLFAVLSVSIMCMMGCVSYPKEVRKALVRAYGRDFPAYYFRGSPVGNFGVGTIYASKVAETSEGNTSAQPDDSWLLVHPNTMYADGLSSNEIEHLNQRIFVSGKMGSVTLTESISTRLDLSATFPNLAQVLNAGVTLDYQNGVKVTVRATGAENRQMNWSEFKKAVGSGKMQDYVSAIVTNSDIVVASKDIILSGYSAEIQVDKTVNPALNAKLNQAVGTVLAKDSSLTLSVGKTNEGVFVVSAVQPVVAAVLFVRPPGYRTVGLLQPTNLDVWTHVKMLNSVLDPVEQLLDSKGFPRQRK